MDEVKGKPNNVNVIKGCQGTNCGCPCKSQESNTQSNYAANTGKYNPPTPCACTCDPDGKDSHYASTKK
jgi:hypothetical protein